MNTLYKCYAAVNGGIAVEAVDHAYPVPWQISMPGIGQFPTHEDRHRAADDTGYNREYQIQRTDILVVG